MLIDKDSAVRVLFYLTDDTDNETPETGLSVTTEISKNGGAWSATTNGEVEIANGLYYVDLTATETNTAGPLAFRATATGTNIWIEFHQVIDRAVEAERMADILLRRNFATVEASSNGDAITTQSLLAILLKSIHSTVSGNTVTVYDTSNNAIGSYTITIDGSGNWTGIDI